MNQPLRIVLFDRDESWSLALAGSLSRYGFSATIVSAAAELFEDHTAGVDAIVISWPRLGDELASIVNKLSNRSSVVVLLADCDIGDARSLYLAGAAEISHPLLPAASLAHVIGNAVTASRKHRIRTRAWQQTA
jgi:FixJ family two-component response regulator